LILFLFLTEDDYPGRTQEPASLGFDRGGSIQAGVAAMQSTFEEGGERGLLIGELACVIFPPPLAILNFIN